MFLSIPFTETARRSFRKETQAVKHAGCVDVIGATLTISIIYQWKRILMADQSAS